MMGFLSLLKHLDMDFGVGCIGIIFLCLLLLFGLKVFQFSWFNAFPCNFSEKCGFCSKDDFGSKNGSRSLKNYNASQKIDPAGEFFDADKEEEQELYGEDKVFDVLTLRKMVKIERRKAKCALLELEKERMASASAAEGAMAMILRLQKEKSKIEMEAKQYKRLAQEKQHHDQEVIRSLQWLVLKQGSESSVVEDELRVGSQRWKKHFMRNNEGDPSEDEASSWSSSNATFEDAIHRRLFSSLDLDLSLE